MMAFSSFAFAVSSRTVDITLIPTESAGGILVPFQMDVKYTDGPGESKLSKVHIFIADYNTGIIKYIVDENTISQPSFWSYILEKNVSGEITSILWNAAPAGRLDVNDDANFYFTALTPSDPGTNVWTWHVNVGDSSSDFDWNGSSTTGPAFPNLVEVPSTISPSAANRSDSVSFNIGVQNVGEAPITLNTTSNISFTDGTNDYIAYLSAPTTVSAGGGTVTLTFNSATIPSSMAQISYDPALTLYGTSYAQVIPTASNPFSVGNNAPSASGLFISPNPAYTDDNLTANYTYSDPDGNPEAGTEIRWYKNGVLQGDLNDLLTVDSALTSKGEDWYFTVMPSDGMSFGTLETSPTLTISNSDPAAADDSASTAEDTLVSIPVLSNDSDIDGDAISIQSVDSPANGSAVINGDNIDYTPSLNYNGADSFTYTISDGTATATATVDITVTPVNDAPVAVDDSVSTAEDTLVSISVLLNDSDVDGDTLTIDSVGTPTNGTAVINGDNIDYTPSLNYNGADSLTYTISDGNETATATVDIIVTPVNDAPVLDSIGSKSVNENELLNFTISGSDVDGDILTFSATDLPSGATFDGGTATFNWTPDYSQAGIYYVIFSVSDGTVSVDESVEITVNNVNTNPTFDPEENPIPDQSFAEDTTVTNAFDLDDYFSDADGDALTYTVAGNTNVIITINPDGTVDLSAATNYNGSEIVTFTASDGENSIDSNPVTITVTPVNDAPILDAIGSKIVDENSLLSFTITGSDIDLDTLTFTATSLPSGADFDSETATFNWTPDFSQSGTYYVLFNVSDGDLDADESVEITVNNVNRAPVLDSIGDKTVTEGNPIDFNATASDPDGDSLNFTVTSIPSGATFTDFNDGTGNFNWVSAQVGTYTVNFLVSDGNLSADQNVIITVNALPPAQPPSGGGGGGGGGSSGGGSSISVCGDQICNGTENGTSCPADCVTETGSAGSGSTGSEVSLACAIGANALDNKWLATVYANGNPLSGLNVLATNPIDNSIKSLKTNANGSVTIYYPENGDYMNVSVDSDGYVCEKTIKKPTVQLEEPQPIVEEPTAPTTPTGFFTLGNLAGAFPWLLLLILIIAGYLKREAIKGFLKLK